MSNLVWIAEWYKKQCNGSWEHDFGIKIETLDNPGWSVCIDTIDTDKVISDLDWKIFEVAEDDWYGYKVIDGQFDGAGDPSKLDKLIQIFRELLN